MGGGERKKRGGGGGKHGHYRMHMKSNKNSTYNIVYQRNRLCNKKQSQEAQSYKHLQECGKKMKKEETRKKKKTPTQSFSEEDCWMAAVKSCQEISGKSQRSL